MERTRRARPKRTRVADPNVQSICTVEKLARNRVLVSSQLYKVVYYLGSPVCAFLEDFSKKVTVWPRTKN